MGHLKSIRSRDSDCLAMIFLELELSSLSRGLGFKV